MPGRSLVDDKCGSTRADVPIVGEKKEKNFWFRQSESTLVDAALHFADWDHLVD